jgi:hypothetical protein
MNIYDINIEIEKCFDDETGEVDIERLNALTLEREKKIENIALYTLDLAEYEKGIADQIDRLTKRKQAITNKKNRLREYLITVCNGEKFKTPLVGVSFRESKSVVVDDVDKLPAEFVQLVTEKKVDKTALKKAFDEWTVIDGAHIERKTAVTVR